VEESLETSLGERVGTDRTPRGAPRVGLKCLSSASKSAVHDNCFLKEKRLFMKK
jgi:hypothetical protein